MAHRPPTPQQPARGTASPRNLRTAPRRAQRANRARNRRTSRLEPSDRHQRPQRQHMVGHNHHRPPRTSPQHRPLGRRTPQTPNPSEAVTRHTPRHPRGGDSLADTASRRGRSCQQRMARYNESAASPDTMSGPLASHHTEPPLLSWRVLSLGKRGYGYAYTEVAGSSFDEEALGGGEGSSGAAGSPVARRVRHPIGPTLRRKPCLCGSVVGERDEQLCEAGSLPATSAGTAAHGRWHPDTGL